MFNLDYGRFRGMDFKKIIIMYGVSSKDKDKYKGREQLPLLQFEVELSNQFLSDDDMKVGLNIIGIQQEQPKRLLFYKIDRSRLNSQYTLCESTFLPNIMGKPQKSLTPPGPPPLELNGYRNFFSLVF